ncbi:hypothetical protein TNCV_609301 [Trichonephila clavipes]|nr:hypothetical protein TNCV_609301 [Trichonephila clavipes]
MEVAYFPSHAFESGHHGNARNATRSRSTLASEMERKRKSEYFMQLLLKKTVVKSKARPPKPEFHHDLFCIGRNMDGLNRMREREIRNFWHLVSTMREFKSGFTR